MFAREVLKITTTHTHPTPSLSNCSAAFGFYAQDPATLFRRPDPRCGAGRFGDQTAKRQVCMCKLCTHRRKCPTRLANSPRSRDLCANIAHDGRRAAVEIGFAQRPEAPAKSRWGQRVLSFCSNCGCTKSALFRTGTGKVGVAKSS